MNYLDGYKQGVKDSIQLIETCKKSLETMLEQLDKKVEELKQGELNSDKL